MEKILGIIGGMGPAATIQFYENITSKTKANKDQEHIRMIILNHTTIPDRTEYILNGKGDEILSLFIKDSKYLKDGGASAIAIPCNTAHYFVKELKKNIDIPVIDMIEETVKEAKRVFGKGKVGILGTDATMKIGLYKKGLEEEGLEPYILSEESQQLVMNIIYRDIKAGNKGNDIEFKMVQKELEEAGCVGAILACTELSVYRIQASLGEYFIDAMDVLENKAIQMMKE